MLYIIISLCLFIIVRDALYCWNIRKEFKRGWKRLTRKSLKVTDEDNMEASNAVSSMVNLLGMKLESDQDEELV